MPSHAHTTLEMQPPTANVEADYLNYWRQERHDAGQIGESGRMQYNQMSTLLGSLAYKGIRELELDKVQLPTEVLHDRPKTVRELVSVWDRANGSFNHMVDGQGDLLRGAGLLLFHNRKDAKNHDFQYPNGEPRDAVEAFTSIFEQNGLDEQQPNDSLLLMGQLIHKAGWVERDQQRQHKLFSMAGAVYKKVYESKTDVDPMTRFKAGEYLMDVRFHNLSRDFRVAKRNNDTGMIHKVRATAGHLLSSQLIDLQNMGLLAEHASSSTVRNEWIGLMVEHLSMIQVRHDIYMSDSTDIKGDIEIRRSFTSEDEPLEIRGQRKTSFDMVVQAFDKDGKVIKTHPIQIKSRRHGYTEEDRRKQYYITEVEVATMEGLTPGLILRGASGLLKLYKHDTNSLKEPALDIVDQSLRPLLVNA